MTPIRARGGLDGLRAVTRGRSPRVASPRAIQTTKGEVGGHPPAARGEDTKRTTHGEEASPISRERRRGEDHPPGPRMAGAIIAEMGAFRTQPRHTQGRGERSPCAMKTAP